ncbi:TlpA family protein disulfide reductase [Flavobacterium rhamnosiphilum]|uniref:TlpA family protein disulfide reductase n=1 Tax=Flavobacterium rhamnosiphilum TaxID=2541724 RepID=A0A4R5FDN8_9FLAO|nr:TlpA disulfide reductase family protein [Flavobacterium rhamnosiphilum]TDE47090.1 TlpA family protein disulfide reductase [Flavobacterium rhamnosiphilum]
MKKIILLFSLIISISTANAQMKIGDSLPDFQLKNNKEATINLASLKGKTVLIDFWASWCAPCRLANKKLAPLYNQYKNENFEIVGISLDTDKTKWRNAIQKDKLAYEQLIDSKGFDAKSAILFGVEELPNSYLFDASGKLVAINPTEEEIIVQIKK